MPYTTLALWATSGVKVIGAMVFDVVIIGGGPAGLTAGIYAARARMMTLLIESPTVMGQAVITDTIENYPGVEKINGIELVDILKRQAASFGLVSRMGDVKKISRCAEEGLPLWKVEDGNGVYHAYSVIAASGAHSKKLGVPGEEEFFGKGVSYCATCDGAFFRDKNIVVVGGGDTAIEEALFLTRFGRKIIIVHRRDKLRATKILQERVFANKKIEFAWESVVECIEGGEKVEKIKIRNVRTEEKKEVPCEGVFVFVGWRPNTAFAGKALKLDEHDAIITDEKMGTSQDGVFAAGDCRSKLLHQVVTACGDGALAAFSAQRYVEKLKGTAYMQNTENN